MAFPLGVHEADPQPGAVHIQHAHGRAGREPVHARTVVSGTPAESGSAVLGGRDTGAKHAAMHPTCGVAQSDREPAAGLPGDPHQTRTVAGLERNAPDDPAGRRLADIFRFEDRENAARTREGLAGVETRSRRKSRGQDFDFVLSRDGRTMTVSIRKKGANRQAGDAQRAGTYTHLDCLEYKDGRLRLRRTGRPLPEGMAPLSPVAHSRLRFAAISSTAVKEHNLPLRPGLYLVAADGRVRFFEGYIPNAPQGGSPEYFGDMTDAVSLSPDKEVLAIGSFPALNGNWWFFSWPDSTPLAPPGSTPSKATRPPSSGAAGGWLSSMSWTWGEAGGPANTPPCGPVSVVAYDLQSGEATRLFPGTAQCDYRVTSVGNGTVTAARRCLPTAGAWAHFPEDIPLKTVTAPLPSPEASPAVSAALCRKRVTTRSV